MAARTAASELWNGRERDWWAACGAVHCGFESGGFALPNEVHALANRGRAANPLRCSPLDWTGGRGAGRKG
eukprot:scaffold736_cov254-Pinguiococcus_pyrenoidosus.AAC.35